MGLMEDIGPGPIGLDTAPFIYFIEQQPEFLPIVRPVFAAIGEGRLAACTSALTLLEVLVVPYRSGQAPLADQYEQFLAHSRGLRLIELDHPQLRAAAQIRARHQTVRTADAIQIAASLTGGCSVFVTNDRQLPQLPGLRVVQLRDYC
jgi:predicted nucleic acid-binding protein